MNINIRIIKCIGCLYISAKMTFEGFQNANHKRMSGAYRLLILMAVLPNIISSFWLYELSNIETPYTHNLMYLKMRIYIKHFQQKDTAKQLGNILSELSVMSLQEIIVLRMLYHNQQLEAPLGP